MKLSFLEMKKKLCAYLNIFFVCICPNVEDEPEGWCGNCQRLDEDDASDYVFEKWCSNSKLWSEQIFVRPKVQQLPKKCIGIHCESFAFNVYVYQKYECIHMAIKMRRALIEENTNKIHWNDNTLNRNFITLKEKNLLEW